nr:hypothetical protein [Gammaproteobacteria bacterium]
FALFDAMLALVLLMIAAAASYTLVKSFRVNSSTQQLIRYSTNITQSFMPFLEGNSSSTVLSDSQLSSTFLTSIGIPAADQANCSTSNYCNVEAGMYVGSGKSRMSFGSYMDTTYVLGSEFAIAVLATGAQVNQMLQSAASMFSIYCKLGSVALSSIGTTCSLLPKDQANEIYSLFLVFPKSDGEAPNINLTPPALGT